MALETLQGLHGRRMFLRVLAVVGSAVLLSASAQWPSAILICGYSDNGVPVFSFDITAAQWSRVMGDESLDALHPVVGSRIAARVDYYVDRSLRVAHWCPVGWYVGEYSFSDGVHHFKGACRRPLRV